MSRLIAGLLLMIGCDGEISEPTPSLDVGGDWVFRLEGKRRDGDPCYYSAVMSLQQQGRRVDGKMYFPNTSCTIGTDTATMVTGHVNGETMTFTAAAPELVTTAQVQGDSMFGSATGPTAGPVRARRVPSEFRLDRPTVRIDGVVNRTFEGRSIHLGSTFRIESSSTDAGIVLDSNRDYPTPPWTLRVGRYSVGQHGDTTAIKGHAWVAGRTVWAKGGHADVLEVTPAYIHIQFEVDGTDANSGERLRFQSDFRMHSPSYLSSWNP